MKKPNPNFRRAGAPRIDFLPCEPAVAALEKLQKAWGSSKTATIERALLIAAAKESQ